MDKGERRKLALGMATESADEILGKKQSPYTFLVGDDSQVTEFAYELSGKLFGQEGGFISNEADLRMTYWVIFSMVGKNVPYGEIVTMIGDDIEREYGVDIRDALQQSTRIVDVAGVLEQLLEEQQ